MSSSKKIFRYFIFTSASIVSGILISAFFVNGGKLIYSHVKNQTASAIENTQPADAIGSGEAKENKIGYFIKNPKLEPKIGAEAYLIGDIDTGEILLEKNPDKALPIASVSKLMTSLVSLESFNSEDMAKVSKKSLNTYGESGNLSLGEKLKISDLLYPLLLESSNDTAEVLASYVDRDKFLNEMNEKARELGMKNTFYDDPSGLSAKNVSTVSDLFKLAKYIKEKDGQIFEITQKPKADLGRHVWFNNNKLITQKNYLGGKSGFTDSAQKTGVALFNVPITKDGAGRNIGIITLRSQDRFHDTLALVNYAKQNLYYGEKDKALSFVPIEKRNELTIKDWVDLTFVGDIMLDRGVRKSVNKNLGNDYKALFKNLSLIASADIAFGNLEGPLSDKGRDLQNLYSFRMAPESLIALKDAGFDALSIANNHIGDWGRPAFDDTLARLKENNILAVGGGINSNEAERPKIIEKNGLKIGFLGFSDVGPESMEARTNSSGILLASNPRLPEIIENASREVDALIVSFHWGEEYQKPTVRQKYLAHLSIDKGAKIIVGTHPHVIQDTEEYEDGYIMYSLGNFIFDQAFSKETMQGLMVEIKLDKTGILKTRKELVKLDKNFQPQTPTPLQ